MLLSLILLQTCGSSDEAGTRSGTDTGTGGYILNGGTALEASYLGLANSKIKKVLVEQVRRISVQVIYNDENSQLIIPDGE